MTIETLKANLPETAKDIRLNLTAVLSEDGTPELTSSQRYGIALASAYATRQADVIQAIKEVAVPAINGCGMCIDAHARTLENEGVSKLAIQTSARIAAVINATAQAIETR